MRPSPPPPSLAAECQAGPGYPPGDLALPLLLELTAEREAAAAECRRRHAGLVKWAEGVTAMPPAR